MATSTHIGILSDNGILRGLRDGTVSIVPFRRTNLNGASYDVTLGPYFYRENPNGGFLNLYHDDAASQAWGRDFCTAKRMSDLEWTPKEADHVNPEERVIVLRPGETILGHTCEFIGAFGPLVPVLSGRSGLERAFVHVEGGLGQPGFVGRWALRITNTSKQFKIPLIAGRKIAQVTFFQSEGVSRPPYGSLPIDKYQQATTLPEIARTWEPQLLLPLLCREAPGPGKLSMTSDPFPLPAFEPHAVAPVPVAPPASGYGAAPQPPRTGYGSAPAPPPRASVPASSMVNPHAGAAWAAHQQQQQYQQPVRRAPPRRDVNGEIVRPEPPPELRPIETRNIRGPPQATRPPEYNPDAF